MPCPSLLALVPNQWSEQRLHPIAGTWDFVARLICEEIVSLPDSARQFIEDKLEEIGDELHSDFEKFGLDTQMMGDYKVEVTDE